MYSGSCLCGQVKFQIEGEFQNFYLCHCKHCQKDTGSAHAANLFSTTAKLLWLQGDDKVKIFNLPGTRHVKSFCLECSSAMPNLQMDGQLLVVPAGSLDQVIEKRPQAHLFCSSKASWDNDLDLIKQFNTFPEF
jgi:hypothetical protein